MPVLSRLANTGWRAAASGAGMAAALVPVAGSAQTPVSNAPFTQLECNTIRVAITEAIAEIGKEKFSTEFKTSLRDFIGARNDCTGPREIVTPTASDIVGFNAIRAVLLAGPNPISLQNAGLRSVPRRTATLEPAG